MEAKSSGLRMGWRTGRGIVAACLLLAGCTTKPTESPQETYLRETATLTALEAEYAPLATQFQAALKARFGDLATTNTPAEDADYERMQAEIEAKMDALKPAIDKQKERVQAAREKLGG
jgi:starvation-inducible outer membrane lipoprotein